MEITPPAPTPPSLSRTPWIIFSCFCLLLPWGVSLALDLPRLMLQNFTDGAFYLGYANHFRLLLDQIGVYYYMVRFPAIAPEAVALTLGGPTALLFYRFLLAGLCCWAVGALLTVRQGVLAGLLGAVLWALNPFALRLVQTAYSDVAGTSFLLLGVCVLCWPQVSWPMAFGAGLFLAAACWSHLHAAVALFFLLPLILLLRWADGWKRLFLQAGCCLLGGVLLTSVASAWYYFHLGLWDLLAPTREVLEMLNTGGIPKPVRSWSEIFTQQTFWFVPLPLAWGAWVYRRDRLVLGAWLGTAGYIGFLALHDWLKGGYSLSLFYYFSFAVPAVVLASAAILGQGLSLFSRRPLGFLLLLLGSLLPTALAAWTDLSLDQLLLGSLLGAVLVAAWAWWKKHPAWMALWLVFLTTGLMTFAPDGRLALGRYWKADDWSLWLAARDLAAILQEERAPGERVRFWLADEDLDARMVQSFFLHAQTQWNPPTPPNAPPVRYPQATPGSARSLRDMGVSLLVLIDPQAGRLRTALENLTASGVSAEVVAEHTWGAEDPWLHTAVLRLPRLTVVPETVTTIPGTRWETHRHIQRENVDDGLLVTLRPLRGVGDAWLPLANLGPGGPDWLQFSLRVERGAVLVELIRDKDQPLDAHARLVVAGSGTTSLIFTVEESMPIALLRIRNFAPHGTGSRVWIGPTLLGQTDWTSAGGSSAVPPGSVTE